MKPCAQPIHVVYQNYICLSFLFFLELIIAFFV